MADVKKCDRCGAIYEKDICKLEMDDYYTCILAVKSEYDLCLNCM